MLREILAAQVRLLTFGKAMNTRPESWWPYLGYVVIVTWIVGMGRYWDSPDAHLAQTLGIGSLAYLFVMSALLWVVIAPIAKRSVTYIMVLIFVGMTAAPAILYAIPVEKFMTIDDAAGVNYFFLLIVATWRVALLFVFCRMAARLSYWGTLTAVLLPLTGIMILLAMFSLEHVTFDLMSGMRVNETYPRSAAGEIASGMTAAAGWSHETVGTLSFLSWILFPVFAVSYIVLWLRKDYPAVEVR